MNNIRKRKIAVITGSRAEYGYLKPLLAEIRQTRTLSLLLYVSGMHLLSEFGKTREEISKDGFKIKSLVRLGQKAMDNGFEMAISMAKGIEGFSQVFNKDKPDIIVVFGDRIEAFVAAVAAAAMNIPIAHISGGEVGLGDIDDSLRHAITKLAHLHFASSEKSRDRILRLGEENWRVFLSGALSLDVIFRKKLLSRQELNKKYGFSDKPLILAVYHPLTTELKKVGRQIKTVVSAIKTVASKKVMEIVFIYPNTYPGNKDIIKEINELKNQGRNVHLFENLPHLDFLSIMATAKVFVGNSSSGIIEAPSLGLPYVCVGTRQKGRERAVNVIEIDCNEEDIVRGMEKALTDQSFLAKVKKRLTPYGNGRASRKIATVLKKIKLDEKLMQKKIID